MPDQTHWEECWREHHECAIKMIEDLARWKRVLETEAFNTWCLTEDNKNDPLQMIIDIATTHVAWTLDPAISPNARALIERGRQESQARIAELEAKLAAYERADAAMSQAMNEGDGVYRP